MCLALTCPLLSPRRPDHPEARVVRSESDGSFTLTLSVPELERAFGKKFKSKTKYKKKRVQDAKHCTVSPLGLALLLLLHLVPLLTNNTPPRLSATSSPLTFSSSFCHSFIIFSFLQDVCAGQNLDSRKIHLSPVSCLDLLLLSRNRTSCAQPASPSLRQTQSWIAYRVWNSSEAPKGSTCH